MPIELTFAAWVTLAVVLAVVLALVREWARPDAIMLAALGALLATGVLGPEAAFAGLSNTAVLAVASLYVVAAGVRNTGALQFLDQFIFPASARPTMATARLMLFTASTSAFLNNTPIVAMLIPRVQEWCDRHHVPSSRLMIPLSYGAIVGGMTTLIGTSTNLLVVGLMEAGGYEPLGMFDFAWVGVPAALITIVYFLTLGGKLLPHRESNTAQISEGLTACAFEMRVTLESQLEGQSLEAAGLRALGGAYLAHIRRDGRVIPSSPDTLLAGNDKLSFVGSVAVLDELLVRPGLEPVQQSVESEGDGALPLFEAVVAPTSALVGSTLKQQGFRERYQGVVLGIQRQDESIDGPISREPIQAGDLLLIEAKSGFDRRWNQNREEFYLVAARGEQRRPLLSSKAPLSLAILLGVILATALGGASIATTSFLGALAMVGSGCIDSRQASKALDLRVLLVIVGALGLGAALEGSGLAGAAAGLVSGPGRYLGVVGVLVLVYFLTSMLTELITNNAAAALMLGVALQAAAAVQAPPAAFALAVAIAASASFITPIGYQTNLMVMAAGNYRFSDYARVGVGLNLLIAATAIGMIWWLWL